MAVILGDPTESNTALILAEQYDFGVGHLSPLHLRSTVNHEGFA